MGRSFGLGIMPEAQAATKMTSMDKYRFKRALEEIEKVEGRGTELVTVYVPPDRPIFEVTNYLRGEYSQSSNIKSSTTRKHVMQAIESIINRLKEYRMPPPNGLVCFVGHKSVGADQTKMVAYVLEPPEPVQSFLYRCDSRFYTEPLHEMLAEKDVYGLLVIDQGEATVGLLEGKRITPVKNVQSLVPRKHRMGGQSARRFERLHEQAVHEFFKKIGELATEAFVNRRELKGILVGGPGVPKDTFVKEGDLHHELEKKVLGTFDTGDTDESGLRELVRDAAGGPRGLDLLREKTLVQRLMEEIRKEDGGLAAYGEDQVRRALELGAVDTLLISEGLRKVRLEIRCPNCGHKETRTVADESTLPKCPNCGHEFVVDSKVDIVDAFSTLADRTNAKVELISADSDEGELLVKAFGGIAAILRYRVA